MSKKIAQFLILLIVSITIISCGDSSEKTENNEDSKTFSVSGTASN